MPLAKKLTRTGFYWHFQDLAELHDAIIEIWQAPILERCGAHAQSLCNALFDLVDCWIDNDLFDAPLDLMIRNWARNDAFLQHHSFASFQTAVRPLVLSDQISSMDDSGAIAARLRTLARLHICHPGQTIQLLHVPHFCTIVLNVGLARRRHVRFHAKKGHGKGTITRRSFLGTSASIVAASMGSPGFAADQPLRRASTTTSRSIHSGHSLTDSYINAGDWPGDLINISNSIGVSQAYENIARSTIPGSRMAARWHNSVTDARPSDPSADARRDIADFDTLMITEISPPPRLGQASDAQSMADTLDYLCRFAANTLENGNGGNGASDIVLWSNWPALTMWRPEQPPHTAIWQEFANFRAALPEFGRSYEFMAEYTSWKMRQTYPSLPDDWRVWVFPGHLWMARVWDDIEAGKVPDVTDMQDLFSDDIHTNGIGGYGLACLVTTCLYQFNLRNRRTFHTPAGISAPLRTYFATLAWDIATSYAPAGMNGNLSSSPLWNAATMNDPLPDWPPSDIDQVN